MAPEKVEIEPAAQGKQAAAWLVWPVEFPKKPARQLPEQAGVLSPGAAPQVPAGQSV